MANFIERKTLFWFETVPDEKTSFVLHSAGIGFIIPIATVRITKNISGNTQMQSQRMKEQTLGRLG